MPKKQFHVWPCALIAIAAAAATWAQTAPTPQALIDDLVVANHILVNENLLDGYGHVSVRNPANPNHYLMGRSGPAALSTAASILEFDLDSNPVTPGGPKGYSERFIHGEIYKARPDVMAVVHCHCPELIPFGDTGVTLRPLYHMTGFLGLGVPVFEIRDTAGGDTDMLITNAKLGHALAQTLGNKNVVLMRGHGAAIVGLSLHNAVGRTYYTNLNAQLQSKAMALKGGNVTYLTEGEAKESNTNLEWSWLTWKQKLSNQK